jgi:hypothetical protein
MEHKEQAIAFHKWMLENDTMERACDWFHFSDEDMYHAFLEETNK